METTNPNKYIDLVAEAIQNRLPAHNHRYCLVFHDGKIQCLPFPISYDIKNVFYVWKLHYRFEGFSGGEWNRIANKITNFFKENPQCTLK